MKKIFASLIILGLMLLSIPIAGALDNGSGNGQNIVVVSDDEIRFEPGADKWRIGYALLSSSDVQANPIFKSAAINGVDIKGALDIVPSSIPVSKLKGLTTAEAARWNALRKSSRNGTLTKAEEREFGHLDEALKKALDKSSGPAELKIAPSKLPFPIEKGQTYPVRVEIQDGQDIQSFTTLVYVQSLPTDPNWVSSQLHVHSDVSDGGYPPASIGEEYKSMGYQVVYMTDHVDLIQSHPDYHGSNQWAQYSSEMANASQDAQIPIYPGLEMTTVDANGYDQGDLLAYGLTSLNGISNRTYTAQQGIDNIANNNPGKSSATIAHPSHLYYPWLVWNVVRYAGYELMSGYQVYFDQFASPMVRWRSELTRLLPNAFNFSYRPAAHAADDWHAKTIDPNPWGYVTFLRTSGYIDKATVINTLHDGKTVASKEGGLGYFKLERNNIVKGIGDTFTGVPTNATININVTFKPVNSGFYSIKIYRDNRAAEIFSQSGNYTAGNTYTYSRSFAFEGDQHYYHLYIDGDGADYIYSTPIYVSN